MDIFLLCLTINITVLSLYLEWAPVSSSAATTATFSKDLKVSPVRESPKHLQPGVTTGPSAGVSFLTQNNFLNMNTRPRLIRALCQPSMCTILFELICCHLETSGIFLSLYMTALMH